MSTAYYDNRHLLDGKAFKPGGGWNNEILAQLRQCVRAFPSSIEEYAEVDLFYVIDRQYMDLLNNRGLTEVIDGKSYATPLGARCVTACEGTFDSISSYLDPAKAFPDTVFVGHLIDRIVALDPETEKSNIMGWKEMILGTVRRLEGFNLAIKRAANQESVSMPHPIKQHDLT